MPSSRSKDFINASVRTTGIPRSPKVLEDNTSVADVSLTDNLSSIYHPVVQELLIVLQKIDHM